jgi:hypothetical protein
MVISLHPAAEAFSSWLEQPATRKTRQSENLGRFDLGRTRSGGHAAPFPGNQGRVAWF